MDSQRQITGPDTVLPCELLASPVEFVLAPLELMVPNDKFTILPVERLQASMEA